MSAMGQPAKRRATYEDVLRAPSDKVAEIVDGDLVLSPRPSPRHALATTELLSELNGRFGKRGSGGWLFLIEPELHLTLHTVHILVPDIAGWRRTTMATLPPDEAFLTVPPDWVCETLSPSTEAFDRVNKLPLYADLGVKHAWLVNPVQQMLEIFQLNVGLPPQQVGRYRGAGMVSDVPFRDGEFALDLGVLWADAAGK